MSLPIKFHLMCGNAFPPTRGHASDSGVDIPTPVALHFKAPGVYKVDLQVAVTFPPGVWGKLECRSSLASCMLISGGVIDNGYRGSLSLVFLATQDFSVAAGERVCQLVLYPLVAPRTVITDSPPELDTPRGDGGFGSTGA